ncbi:MAG: type 1 glutamine amidotransferase domain-containing protein [Acidimicrobiaceae bacterium]|nr:type 1 glutamine amidotransferase domain-containing protein [Acidimicrobiaceae bacterium]
MPKVLIVLSSHDRLGESGKPTGWLLSEAAVPWDIFTDAGLEIDFVSPAGGKAPMTGDKTAPESAPFLEAYGEDGPDTVTPDDVSAEDYEAIFYVGGHGAMYDFADNQKLAEISSTIWERGGIVSAVCHGPAGLLNVKLGDGTPLIQGRHVSAWPDDQESAAQYLPFMLQSALESRGAVHEGAPRGESKVVVDDRLITGQNPQSCVELARTVVDTLATVMVG